MTQQQMRIILVVAGGSGGHIFPAVGFCQEFRKKHPDAEIVFVTAAGKKAAEFIPAEFRPVFVKAERSFSGIFIFFLESLRVMKRVQPDVVVGFGGYLSVPFILLAKCFGRKTVIHEQNVSLGKANRFLCASADRVAVSFAGTAQRLKAWGCHVVLARYPVRALLQRVSRPEAAHFFGFDERLFTVLVAGGSQGAHRINDVVIKAVCGCGCRRRMQMIHLAGLADADAVEQAYREMGVRCKVFAFLKEMNYAYSVADLVISRAGAGTVFEIAAFGLSSFLIPYPYAGRHQVENAGYLAKEGAALLFEEKTLTSQSLGERLEIFLEDPTRRNAMAARASALFSGAENPSLADIVDSLR